MIFRVHRRSRCSQWGQEICDIFFGYFCERAESSSYTGSTSPSHIVQVTFKMYEQQTLRGRTGSEQLCCKRSCIVPDGYQAGGYLVGMPWVQIASIPISECTMISYIF